MDGTILGQGSFTATATANPNPGSATVGAASPVTIVIPSGVDWLKVYDYTQAGTAGNDSAYFNGTDNACVGYEFYWQRGMAAGTGMVKYLANTTSIVSQDTFVSGGFTLYDPSGQTPGSVPLLGNPVATTASTNATRPVVSTTNTAGISVGTIVRMSSTAQTDVNGIDMVVGAVTANTSFTLLTATNALATAPGAIGGGGSYRIVNFNPLFYPARRFVTNITQATNAQVSTSVAHGYVPGQAVRFNIPTQSGMIQLNPTAQNNYVYATVVSVVDNYNFTIDQNTTSYTAFTWPTIAQQPSSFPSVEPVGENTAQALLSPFGQTPTYNYPATANNLIYNANTGILSDATVNTGYLGMVLGSGGDGTVLTTPITGPAGTVAWTTGNVPTGDTLYWVAGKSTYGGL